MTVEFNLPDIGEGLHEAEIIEWLVAEGDIVERNQPFVEILTDKSQTEMPAPAAGRVERLGGSVGDIVQVGELLIVIEDDGSPARRQRDASRVPGAHKDDQPAVADTPQQDQQEQEASAFLAAIDAPIAPAPRAVRPKASPSTRRLAAELGIDLQTVTGTGPGGRILAVDVESAESTPAPAAVAVTAAAAAATTGAAVAAASSDLPNPATSAADAPTPVPAGNSSSTLGQLEVGEHPLRGIRRATAKAMDVSWSTIPHVTAMDEVDASELLLTRKRAKAALGDSGASVTPLALLMVAVARSLRAYPMFNATLALLDDKITVHDDINIAIAVATDRGLMVPVVRSADKLGVSAMATEIARLSAAARDGSIGADDLAGSTFTVSNYGSNGGYFAAPIIRPGESGIVGFGAIKKRPTVVDDEVVARPMLPIVIAADHRLIDGDVLSAFQAHLSAAVTEAIQLLL